MLRHFVEESPCSHGAEMPVVFVPGETISQGNPEVCTGLTAGKEPTFIPAGMNMVRVPIKVPQWRSLLGNREGGTR